MSQVFSMLQQKTIYSINYIFGYKNFNFMRYLLFILFVSLFLFTNHNYAQNLKITNRTVIKNVDGKRIKYNDFMDLISTGDWTIHQKNDKKGKSFIQLVKNTPEQKKRMLEIMPKVGENSSASEIEGTLAPDFIFTDVDGNIIYSQKLKGKVIVFNFWFATCPPCIKEIPELNTIYEKYKNNTDIVFASLTFESKKKIDAFEKKYPISYPVVSAPKSEISKFKVSGYPTNLIIGKDGKFSFYRTGGFPGIGKVIEVSIEKALK